MDITEVMSGGFILVYKGTHYNDPIKLLRGPNIFSLYP